MINQQRHYLFYLLSAFTIALPCLCVAQVVSIKNDKQHKQLQFGNSKMNIVLNYDRQARITSLLINGAEVLDTAGVFSTIKTGSASYATRRLLKDPVVSITGNNIVLSGIAYGDAQVQLQETWKFGVNAKNINFSIERTLPKAIEADEVALPAFTFNSISTWDGAYQSYGGLAWFYLFKPQDVYGVHSNWSDFWNSKTGNGLRVEVGAPGNKVAMVYSRTAGDKLGYAVTVAAKEMLPRYDTGTSRRRYIRGKSDGVWAPFVLPAGTSSQSITLSYFDFNEKYGRGKFTGIDGSEVSAVLNTIARIGVIDKQHFGGNSWHTPYGPICLHEQYIAQMGLAINDSSYLNGYRDCLDFYRDNAIKPDGRVWARWAYSNEDMMPGEVTDKGFYEAQWGYLLDANPDLVSNVAELYDQTGDKAWVKTHQRSCEKALDWILARDENKNGLVEMMTDSHNQKKGSDWIDIIWASYENAFVNAKLYHALVLWADIEKQLGNNDSYRHYSDAAVRLKTNFNKPTTEGGFWNKDKQCYIHWRDKDGSAHGNNMVTPVNFMAIGYGICDDSARTKSILENIETQMQQEQLFFWPLCMKSYEPGDGNDWQFPFPNYENGDIFLSWGALGVKAYAYYKPELALKYVKNVLAQYAKDGLAFQRYGRAKQDGLGDDILSGNSLSVVGLYQAIYGINPMYNRFYLNPHITAELAGTQLRYNYRGQNLLVDLAKDYFAVSNSRYKIIANADFGFYGAGNDLLYFKGNNSTPALQVKTLAGSKLTLEVKSLDADKIVLNQSSVDKQSNRLRYQFNGLAANSIYTISFNNLQPRRVSTNANGSLVFAYKTSNKTDAIVVEKRGA